MASGLARIALINVSDGSVTIRDTSNGSSRVYIGLSGCAEAIATLLQQAEDRAKEAESVRADLSELRTDLAALDAGQATLEQLDFAVERTKTLARSY